MDAAEDAYDNSEDEDDEPSDEDADAENADDELSAQKEKEGVEGEADVKLPSDSAHRRSGSLFGSEVPSYERQLHGAVKGRIDDRVGRGCTSTLQFVRLLFTDAVLDRLVESTNKAAHEHPRVKNLTRIKRFWKDVTRDRMLLWLGVCGYLGVVKVQNRKCVWSRRSMFRQKWCRGAMQLEDFENILNAVNFCDHWSMTEAEFTQRNNANRWWQIEELIKECNANSQLYFRLGHRI
jgi:hypothetical protein